MFTDVHLKNFATFSDFRWSGHGQVNVIVGENDTGKSHLLRVLYAIAKSAGRPGFTIPSRRKLSVPTRSRPPPPTKAKIIDISEVFRNKLRWTFQTPPSLDALIKDGAEKLVVEAHLAGTRYNFTVEKVGDSSSFYLHPDSYGRAATTTVFLPPKEVLTSFAAIAISRDSYEIYGFDDTYNDLLKLLRVPPTQGEVVPDLLAIANDLEAVVGGRLVKNGILDEFLFQRGERIYTMSQTADGIKKLGILSNLLKNRSLNKGTILLLDEPETNLHPRWIAVLTETLFRLGQAGVQVYVATHSYFVLKKLEILAKQHKMSVPFCSLLREGDEIAAQFSDLKDGMPDNPIVDESLRLYQEEIDVDRALLKARKA